MSNVLLLYNQLGSVSDEWSTFESSIDLFILWLHVTVSHLAWNMKPKRNAFVWNLITYIYISQFSGSASTFLQTYLHK